VFSRVLVANRGEIAVRVIRALHELDVEAVAIYSTADKDAQHVRMADHAVCVGPPAATDSYLRIPSVIAAASTTDCQAVHPGYGFLAENPLFVEACVDNDLVFVGPPADVMGTMGDKISAKQAMRAADVPIVPGTEEETSVAQARRAADEMGYPILLKASAGGGGKGMRLVSASEDIVDAFGAAAAEAQAAFGDPRLYVEKAVSPARHVEIQVICDHHGNVLTLGERECSIQRRHQKLIEESPSAALTPEAREQMEAAAERACIAVGYRNAGTFEFLLGPDGSFYVTGYLRSWAFEAQLREYLRSELGNDWFAKRDAGDLLRELWSLGQGPTADALLKDVTGAKLEMASVAERIREGIGA